MSHVRVEFAMICIAIACGRGNVSHVMVCYCLVFALPYVDDGRWKRVTCRGLLCIVLNCVVYLALLMEEGNV